MSKEKMQIMVHSVPVLSSMFGFLLVYALVVVLMFRVNEHGLRRRWQVLDFVWVPLGGLTGMGLLVLWWSSRLAM
jgi:hypothetical protein